MGNLAKAAKPSKLTPREELKSSLALTKIAPYEMLQPAFDARGRGCSLQTAAGAAGIAPRVLTLMLELGEEGHPVFEEVYTCWARKEASLHAQVDEAEMDEAINGDKISRQMVRRRDQGSTYEPLYLPEVASRNPSAQFPGGIEIVYNKFTAPEPVDALPVIEGEVMEDTDENV